MPVGGIDGTVAGADSESMRGLIAIAALLGVAVLVRPAGSAATTATAVGVSEREWSVSLGRLKAPHGPITFNITNYGQDDHDITVRKHGYTYGFLGRIASAGRATLTVRLKPGVYNISAASPATASWAWRPS